MVELAIARAKVEAAATADAARAAAAELEALCGSSTSSSVSADGGIDDELKRAREAAREQATQWAAAHPRGAVAAAQTGVDASMMLCSGERVTTMPPMATATQTGADAPTAGSTEIVAFTGGVTLPPRTGTMVTVRSMSLLGTSVPTVGGLHSDRQDIIFQEDNNIDEDKGTLPGPFQSQYGSSAPAHLSAS
jgi:hypothetical protein